MNVTDVVCSVRDEFGSSISKTLILRIPDCLKIIESTDVLLIVFEILMVLIIVYMVYLLIVLLRTGMVPVPEAGMDSEWYWNGHTAWPTPTSDDKPEEEKVSDAHITLEQI